MEKVRYKEIKKATESCVVFWEWAGEAAYNLLPFENERQGKKLAKPFSTEPKSKKNCFQYGFDKRNNLIVVRKYSNFDDKYFETFIEYSEKKISSVNFSYDSPKKILSQTEQLIENGLISKALTITPFGLEKHEDYEYDNNSISLINFEQIRASPKQILSSSYVLNYANGEPLEIVWNDPGGNSSVVYRVEKLDENQITKSNTVKEALVTLILRTVQPINLSEPAFCLAINYGNDLAYALPPTLGIGLQAEKDAMSGEDFPEKNLEVWDPAEFENFGTKELSLVGSEFQSLFLDFNRKLSQNNDRKLLRNVLVEAARKLNKFDWQAFLSVTPDFLVYPVDDELLDLTDNFIKLKR